jgi:hypothetical protein
MLVLQLQASGPSITQRRASVVQAVVPSQGCFAFTLTFLHAICRVVGSLVGAHSDYYHMCLAHAAGQLGRVTFSDDEEDEDGNCQGEPGSVHMTAVAAGPMFSPLP